MLVLSSILFATFVAIGATLSLSYSNNNYLKAQNEEQEYTLTLDSTTPLDPDDPNSKSVIYTPRGTPLTFAFSNYSTEDNNFGILAQNGYVGNETMISGLKSITPVFSGEGTIRLVWSWANPAEGQSTWISSGTTYSFNDGYPLFFTVINTVETPRVFKSITLTYSCDVNNTPAAKRGLTYTLNADNQSYSVSGSSKSLKAAIISEEYEGKPVTDIKDNGFEYCGALSSALIPNSVTTIGSSAFSSSGLQSLVIPDSVTTIKESAFQSCDKLKSIKLSNNLTVIPQQAFDNCSSLTSIDVPNGVISLEDAAFEKCTNLESISLPRTLQSIKREALSDCENLKVINFGGTTAEWNAIEKEWMWDYGTIGYQVICTDS